MFYRQTENFTPCPKLPDATLVSKYDQLSMPDSKTSPLRAFTNRAASMIVTLFAIVFLYAIPAGAAPLQFTPTDFTILSADGQQKIGYCSFHLEKTATGTKLHGASRYTSGETDFETITLETPDNGDPRPIDFEHTFYDAAGKATLSTRANFITGAAICTDYRPESLGNETAALSFPPDTWAGASVAIPIQQLLQASTTSTTRLHFFSCAPGPKIFTVDIAPDSARSRWPLYPGELVKVEVRPFFGLFDVLVRAFVPHLEAWFDPSSSWDFVGAQMARYYKGPAIIMVKAPKTAPARALSTVKRPRADGTDVRRAK